MSHNHAHGPGQVHAPASYGRVFAWGVGLNVGYVIVEAGSGFLTGSLALLADAGHNLSDVLGLLLAWGGNYLATSPPTKRYTYGFRSSSILAAVSNALILLVAIGAIIWEAVRRFETPESPAGATVMIVAAVGAVINGITTWLFVGGRKHDINIRGAYLHMAADTAVSVGVVFAGLAIMLTRQPWIDPAVSIAIALAIFAGTWQLLRESIDLLLQAVPRGIDPDEVAEFLRAQEGVEDLHDLHIWPMSTTETALTVHLVKPHVANDDAFLARLCHELEDRFRIGHATIQIERTRTLACRLEPPTNV